MRNDRSRPQLRGWRTLLTALVSAGRSRAVRIPARSFRAAAGLTMLTFAVIAAGGALLAARVDAGVDRNAQQAMTRRTTATATAVSAEIVRYLDSLRLVAATLQAVDTIDADAFAAATGPLSEMDLAGATSLAFLAPPVTSSEVDELEARWRARGDVDLELVPADDGALMHLFSIFSAPLDNSTANRTGIDVSVAAAPHEALMEAWRSGGPALSDAYQLIIDQALPAAQRQTSFSLTLPVTRGSRHLGWVLMGIRGQDFLGHVLDHAAEGQVVATLVADDIAGNEASVAATSTEADVDRATAARALRDYERIVDLTAVQHVWTLRVGADRADLVGATGYRPDLIRAGALIAALMASALVWSILSRRERTRTQIETATAELIAAEAATRQEAALFTTTLDTIEEVGVSVIDETGTFLLHSRAARAILGVDADPAPLGDGGPATTGIGDADSVDAWQQHYGIFTTDGAEFSAEAMPLVRGLAGESTDGVEMVIRNAVKPDGVHIVVSGRPINLGDGRRGALAVFRDVTLERQQHAELTGFAGIVAHDLKRPLTITTAYLDLLADDVLPALDGDASTLATAYSHLDRVQTASYRMAGLIDSLLAYTTAQDSHLHTRFVDLGDLVRETVQDLVPAHTGDGGGHVVTGGTTDTDRAAPPHVHVGELPTVEADPDRLRQVFANLIANSLKYVAPGATPHLDITSESYKSAGTLRARILVADRGIGIAPRDRTRVLQPFERAHTETLSGTAYTGTGLGLAICARIVRRHGGTLTLQANPGGGTIAAIDVPFVHTHPTSPPPGGHTVLDEATIVG